MLRAATAQDGLSNYPSGSLLGPWELTTVLVMALTLTLVAVLAGNDSFYMHIATTVVITAGFALSLGVITRVGYWSLGHASFMGLGAYASVLAVTKLAMPIVVGLVCAMLIGGLTAAPIGAVLMRLRGAYFIMVTFALGELVRLTFVSESSIFGGSGGITKIPPLVFTGLGGRFSSPLFSAYLLASALLVSEMVILLTIVRSSIGRIWDSIRENPDLAESQGIPIHRYKVYAFVIGGAMAGLAGALQAHYLQFISPSMYDFSQSIKPIVAVIVGGSAFLVGPLLGASLLGPLPELFREWHEYERIFYGITLALVVLLMPYGVVGFVRRMVDRFRRA